MQPDLLTTFLGRLSLECRRGRPTLTLSFRCTACHGLHHHSWSLGGDGLPTHRFPHCWRESSPFRNAGYLIKPEPTEANEHVLREYARLLEVMKVRATPSPAKAG